MRRFGSEQVVQGVVQHQGGTSITARRGVTVVVIAVISGSRKLPSVQRAASLKDSRFCKGCNICKFSYSPGGGSESSASERHLEAASAVAIKHA